MHGVIIGNTGFEVKRLGFGGIPVQRVSEQQTIETVLNTLEKGVDFVETARRNITGDPRIGLALKQTEKELSYD